MIETASQLPLPWCSFWFARHSGPATSVASQHIISWRGTHWGNLARGPA